MSVAHPALISGPHLGIDADKATLGACLGNNAAASQAAAIVRPEDFALETNRRIAAVIFQMAAADRAVDPLTVATEMNADDGLKAYLHTLTSPSVCPTASNVREYALIVQRNSLRQRLGAGLQNALARLQLPLNASAAVDSRSTSLEGLWR